MNEVFGKENFKNQITWHYYNKYSAAMTCYPRAHDDILFYTMSSSAIFNEVREQRETPVKQLKRVNIEGVLKNARDEDGNILYQMSDDKKVDDVWRIPQLQPASSEWTGYSTQKHHDLLERIILASSNPNSIVADLFCGSGTTLAVAERLGRKWIGADLGRFSIHTTRKRMLQIQRELHSSGKLYRSFDVYNLGRYERQWWQAERLHGADTEHRATVMKFYKATELVSPPNSLLHGKKGGAVVHVDEIDGMFTGEELVGIVQASSMAGAKELHILAWEFEMELTVRKQALEAEYGIQIRLIYIPREIMESNRTECQFFEAGYLKAKILKSKDGRIDVELENFIPALAEAPEAELAALRERSIKSPFDFIDFWAVDFDYREDKPFEHHWQDYRIKKKRSLATKTDLGWMYHEAGNHRICVKVIDVFGVDTTIVISVEA